MPVKFTDQYRRQVVTRYDAARRDGVPVGKAALLAGGGHSISVINDWRAALAEADSDDGPRQIAKRRQCLRCRRDFRSTWAGHRVCDRCKGGHALDGLPAGFAETATLGVVDR